MALEAADDDLDVEIFDELDSYSKIFEELSLQLLEFSYQSDDDLTQHLLTASLDNWSRQTCLSLAVVANNLRLENFCNFVNISKYLKKIVNAFQLEKHKKEVRND